MRPIRRKNLPHTVEYYRPKNESKSQTIKYVKVDRASSISQDLAGTVISGGSRYEAMVLIVDRVSSIYTHMDIKEKDRIVFKDEEYTVLGVVEQTANKTDDVQHWEVYLI